MKLQITLKGPIKAIGDVQTFASGFRKRTVTVENLDDKDSKWDQPINFEMHKDACDRLDNFKVGDDVEVTADVQGNEHNGKFYVSLRAWKIVKLDRDGNPVTGRTQAPDRGDPMAEHERNRARQRPAHTAPTTDGDGDEDEIPF
jgi:hypothetical protein